MFCLFLCASNFVWSLKVWSHTEVAKATLGGPTKIPKPCSLHKPWEKRICHEFRLDNRVPKILLLEDQVRSPKGYRLYKGVPAVPFLFWYFRGLLSYRDPIHRPTEVFSWYSREVLFPNLFGIIRGHSCNTLVPKHCNRDTVDGRHPAPVDMANSWKLFRYLQGFYTSQVVQDFFQQYYGIFSGNVRLAVDDGIGRHWSQRLFLGVWREGNFGNLLEDLDVGVSWMIFILRID